MDFSRTQQKYNHYMSLCVSVMGQRRFRISMGALIPSPEAGDASVIIPKIKKCIAVSDHSSKGFLSKSDRNIINRSTFMSASNYNNINDEGRTTYRRMILMEDNVFNKMSTSTIHDQCQFPYYRSSKNSGRFPDTVLVKDVGVSCMLLNQDFTTTHIPETKILVKQLKKEYNDLSSITSKITMYTKDILSHLRKKNRKKYQLLQHLISSKHAIASQYIDNKGNLCLKLRLFKNAETQCTPQNIVKAVDSIFKDKYVARNLHCNHSNTVTCQEGIRMIHNNDIQTETMKENVEVNITNSSPNTSIYNYLMMRNRKTSNGKFNPILTKPDKNRNNDKDHKGCLKRCEPVILTNWKEISKSNRCKIKASSVISDELQEMEHAKKEILQKLILNSNMINNVPNTKFHTFNIRIVKQNKKHI